MTDIVFRDRRNVWRTVPVAARLRKRMDTGSSWPVAILFWGGLEACRLVFFACGCAIEFRGRCKALGMFPSLHLKSKNFRVSSLRL